MQKQQFDTSSILKKHVNEENKFLAFPGKMVLLVTSVLS